MKRFKEYFLKEQQDMSLNKILSHIKNDISYEVQQPVKIEIDATQIPILLHIYVKNLMTGEKTEKVMRSQIGILMQKYPDFQYHIMGI